MTGASVTVRDLTASDVEACCLLVERTPLFHPYGYGREAARKDFEAELARARPESTMLVALQGERIVGFARFVVRGAFDRCGYLRLIVVDPDVTGAGVGRRLLAELEALHLQPSGIMLLCAKDNVGAQRFYEHLGYERVGELPSYVQEGLDELIYYKRPPCRTA